MKIIKNSKHAQDIPVRQMDFSFPTDTPKYWADNNQLVTLFMTALSASFPPGEMGFVRSVRHYQDLITDPKLQAEVRSFIGQEAHHGKEHSALNDFMDSKGVPVKALEKKVDGRINYIDPKFSPARRLAGTCALEHFTALFAERLMSHPEFIDKLHPNTQAIWLWHSIEESEHKSVAFDVFNNQVGSYFIRVRAMAIVSILFPFFMGKNAYELITADDTKVTLKSTVQAAKLLFGRKGFFRGMLPKYLAYYHPNFHPSNDNTEHLRIATLALLEQRLGQQAS